MRTPTKGKTSIKKFIRNIYFRLVYNLYIKQKINSVARERLGGFTFVVHPTVFNPTDFISSELLAEFIKSLGSLNGRRVLDMGSGSGVVSVFAAYAGADCAAADINPMAIRSIKENAALNGFTDKITAVESDLFENPTLKKKYDIIFFNPPYYKGKPKDNFERAFKGGANLEVITRFLSEAKNYLKPMGVTYFIVSSDMDIKELHGMFTTAGYKYRTIKEIKKFFETFYIIEAVV